MPEILAADIGTSRMKCAFFDENGNMSGLSDRRLDRAASPDTQDARVWFSALAELIRNAAASRKGTPDAIALTGNMHALLGIGNDGEPVAPALLWSGNSATAESDALNAKYGDYLLKTFGNASIPVFTLPKMLREKEIFRRSRVFLQSKDYIGFRLTGRFATDPTDASGVLAMRLADGKWDESFLRELNLDPGKFPEILPSASILGRVTREAARLTGLPAGTPVVTGCGDLSSAALGGGVNRDTLSLTLGTAGQLLGTGDPGTGKRLAGKLFVFAHADPEQELYLGSVPSGGFSFEWLAGVHGLGMAEFFRLAAETPLTADLPVFAPYLLGRGAPYMDYRPCGEWRGLSAHHTRGELCRGAVAGTLCPLRQCADLLEELSGRRKVLVLQALACRETAVRETAEALFREEEKDLPRNSEASLLGAAAVGMTALGVHASAAAAGRAMVGNLPAEPAPSARMEAAEAFYRRFRGFFAEENETEKTVTAPEKSGRI